jgi:hypothetical protein
MRDMPPALSFLLWLTYTLGNSIVEARQQTINLDFSASR